VLSFTCADPGCIALKECLQEPAVRQQNALYIRYRAFHLLVSLQIICGNLTWQAAIAAIGGARTHGPCLCLLWGELGVLVRGLCFTNILGCCNKTKHFIGRLGGRCHAIFYFAVLP
jgi:hypothetical protein